MKRPLLTGRACLDQQGKNMKTRTLQHVVAASLLALAATGCSTWDNMSQREKSATVGAGVGGVAGAAVTGGGVLGTVGGAAIGGVVGDQVGKNR